MTLAEWLVPSSKRGTHCWKLPVVKHQTMGRSWRHNHNACYPRRTQAISIILFWKGELENHEDRSSLEFHRILFLLLSLYLLFFFFLCRPFLPFILGNTCNLFVIPRIPLEVFLGSLFFKKFTVNNLITFLKIYMWDHIFSFSHEASSI